MEPDNEMLGGESWDCFAEESEARPDQAYEEYVSEGIHEAHYTTQACVVEAVID